MTILQAGFPKSGNLWLWRTISALHEECGVARNSYVEGRVDSASISADELSFAGQESVDVIDIDPGGPYVRVGYTYRERLDDVGRLVAASSHVWTHSPILDDTVETFQPFDRIVYIIRDPRDVAISMSHFKFSPYMLANDPSGYEDPERYLSENLLDLCRDWAKHVVGYLRWQEALDIKILFYERMAAEFKGELRGLADYLGLAVDEAGLTRIAESVSVKSMKAEDPHHVRRGGWGGWKDKLTEDQKKDVQKLVGSTLDYLGYPDMNEANGIDTCLPELPRPAERHPDELQRLLSSTRLGWSERLGYAVHFIRDPRPWSVKLRVLARWVTKPGELLWKLR